jgi:transcriptional regulator with XRE-family HTH domain
MAMMTHSEIGAVLGPRLREARMSAGLSEDELGYKVYATARSIRGYENGIIIPNLMVVCNLAKVLGVSVGWLLDGEEATLPKEDVHD